MSQNHETLEREFEDQLIDVLTQDYDLRVRCRADNIDRRRQRVAALRFAYRLSVI